MQNVNLDLKSPERPLSKKHLGKILTISIGFPCRHFWHIFNISVKETKKWKSLKSGGREIQFQQVFNIAKIFPGVFWKKDVQGNLNLESYFAFHNLVCVWECIKDKQKKQVCKVAKFRGYFEQV